MLPKLPNRGLKRSYVIIAIALFVINASAQTWEDVTGNIAGGITV